MFTCVIYVNGTEVRTVIALPEKYQENHDAALLKWKKTKVRPMSGPPIRYIALYVCM